MKIVINISDFNIINEFIKAADDLHIEVINARSQNTLNSLISESYNAFILSNDTKDLKDIIKSIKKYNENTPIFIINNSNKDIETIGDFNYIYNTGININLFSKYILLSVNSYYNKFNKLQKLTEKPKEIISFGSCKYDPLRRILSFKNKEVKKLSPKEGGILEILATNFKSVIKKEFILQQV
jgi:DNA-binding response OmpR family regulator